MSMIMLTEDQMDVLRMAVGPVLVCDRDGVTLGTVNPDLRHELTIEIPCRSSEDRRSRSSAEITALFKFLEEVEAKEGRFDKRRLNELIQQFHDQYDGR